MTSPADEAPINAPRDKQFLVTRKDVLLPAGLPPCSWTMCSTSWRRTRPSK